ncbi:hypothetical protein T11_11017 [Trichinella zimbabwensis]|uniref:PiggyBac transposable element-derived protein domain-containing protein n=1 Tax=Trichinella zimbabwensis TaxID=268475 RepID=A0A0V1HD62_9BILA|nr:hypothetical protein T11_11017 [Trichinella zimbabwensis]
MHIWLLLLLSLARDGVEKIASHWRSETRITLIESTESFQRRNIKQISEHKQLTTLNNVDCRISKVLYNNARIQKAIDNLKSLFLLALLRGKAIFIDS